MEKIIRKAQIKNRRTNKIEFESEFEDTTISRNLNNKKINDYIALHFPKKQKIEIKVIKGKGFQVIVG